MDDVDLLADQRALCVSACGLGVRAGDLKIGLRVRAGRHFYAGVDAGAPSADLVIALAPSLLYVSAGLGLCCGDGVVALAMVRRRRRLWKRWVRAGGLGVCAGG